MPRVACCRKTITWTKFGRRVDRLPKAQTFNSFRGFKKRPRAQTVSIDNQECRERTLDVHESLRERVEPNAANNRSESHTPLGQGVSNAGCATPAACPNLCRTHLSLRKSSHAGGSDENVAPGARAAPAAAAADSDHDANAKLATRGPARLEGHVRPALPAILHEHKHTCRYAGCRRGSKSIRQSPLYASASLGRLSPCLPPAQPRSALAGLRVGQVRCSSVV